MATEVLRTIGTGKDHSTLADFVSWVVTNYPNCVTSDVYVVGEVWPGAGTDGEHQLTAVQSLNSITTDATRYLELRAAAGESFMDHVDAATNPLRYDRSKGVGFVQTTKGATLLSWTTSLHLHLIGLQFSHAAHTGGVDNGSRIFQQSSGNTGVLTMENCIVGSHYTAGAASMVELSGTLVATNCLFYNSSTSGGRPLLTTPVNNQMGLHNCTIYTPSSSVPLIRASFPDALIRLRNTALFGGTVAFESINNYSGAVEFVAGSTNNATNQTSLDPAGTQYTSLTAADQFESVTVGSYDFRAKSGGDLAGFGIRDQTYTADLDIVGQSRSTTTPTIGAWEVAGAPNPPTGVTAGSITALSATASWTDNSSDETGFKVQYAPSPYTSWTTVTGSPTAANATSLATGNVLTDGTSYKFRVASTNANGDSAYVESGVFTTPALTRLRPNADTTVGAWTPSTGSTLFGVIDETTPDDADYITASTNTTGKVKVEVSTDPADDTNHSVSIRARATSGTLTVSLVQGHPSETLIKAWTPSLTSSFATYVLTMSSGEAAAITDYSDLYLKFVTT
jgi:hypothetical protein